MEIRTLIQIAVPFPDDLAAESWFIRQRWADGVTCPHCDSERVSERTNARDKKAWRCKDCRKDFTAKTGTLMQGSNLGYRTWAMAVYLLTTNLKDIANTKLANDLNITQKSAWHLAMRIHETYYRQQKSEQGVGKMKVANQFIVADAVNHMNEYLTKDSIDLTVTSPPYGDLRNYEGYSFEPVDMLTALFRVTKQGGVVVWVVGDKINGGRSLASFGHALIARDVGFRVHDVMIYQKKNTPFMRSNAYTNCYELMIVLSKGNPKTFNPIKVPTKRSGVEMAVSNKGPDAINRKVPVTLKKTKTKTNIWAYAVGFGGSTKDKLAFDHPAIFPEKLAEDHILSWSNKGDIVLDPMCGSGTTCKMAALNGRKWLGIDISEKYISIAQTRLEQAEIQVHLEQAEAQTRSEQTELCV